MTVGCVGALIARRPNPPSARPRFDEDQKALGDLPRSDSMAMWSFALSYHCLERSRHGLDAASSVAELGQML
jgi:hypothetical protein